MRTQFVRLKLVTERPEEYNSRIRTAEEAVRMIEFSPHDQMSEVLAHVVGKLEA